MTPEFINIMMSAPIIKIMPERTTEHLKRIDARLEELDRLVYRYRTMQTNEIKTI